MNPKICIFGDSLTQGDLAKELDGWANMLKQDVKDRGFGDGIINLGIGGHTSVDVLERFDRDLEPYPNTSAIIIAIGYNDAIWLCDDGCTQVSYEDFCTSIAKLGEKASKLGPVVFVGLTICKEKMEWIDWLNRRKERKMEFIRKNDAFIKNYCIKNNIHYIFVEDCVSPEDLSDNAHPGKEGHQKLFQRIKPALKNWGMVP